MTTLRLAGVVRVSKRVPMPLSGKNVVNGWAVLVVGLALVATSGSALAEKPGRSPEDTVKAYLSALQGHRFPEAYDYVSKALRGDKPREVWAKEQQYIIQFSEFKLLEFKVFPAVMVGDKARVPNLLKSQDKFLNQLGLDEHELYDLVIEEGQWRIDQQTLVQGLEKAEYFGDG